MDENNNRELTVLQPNSSLQVRYKQLTDKSKKVYHLIQGCIENKIVLDQQILEHWFLEEIVKPRERIKNGNYLGYRDANGYAVYERISEYEFLKREQKAYGYIRCYWLGEAKQILKYNIGVLVLKDFLAVLPKISLDNIPDTIKEIN